MCVGDGQPWHLARLTEGRVHLLCKARCFIPTAVHRQGRDSGLPEKGVLCASVDPGRDPTLGDEWLSLWLYLGLFVAYGLKFPPSDIGD